MRQPQTLAPSVDLSRNPSKYPTTLLSRYSRNSRTKLEQENRNRAPAHPRSQPPPHAPVTMAKGRKRKYNSIVAQGPTGASPSAPSEEPPALPIVRFGEFKLTTNAGLTRPPSPSPPAHFKDPEDDGWERAGKRQKKSKLEKTRNIPEMMLSPQRLKSPVKVSDLQNLVLWLVADGTAPQWLMVRVRFFPLFFRTHLFLFFFMLG